VLAGHSYLIVAAPTGSVGAYAMLETGVTT
jgi:hypothetical protein